MKKVLILATAILMCAGLAVAQDGGHIGLYADEGYTECNLDDSALLYTNATIYIVHSDAPESNTSQFRIEVNWPTAVEGALNWNGLDLGDVNTGILVTYGGCKALPYLMGTWNWFVVGAAPECTVAFEVLGDPLSESGEVESVDCSSTKHIATGGKLTVNGNETCPCEPPVSTQDKSWSQIKALYR
jgi:hypothetical protein